MRARLLALFLASLSIAGCASIDPRLSYADVSASTDQARLSTDLAGFIRTQLPPATTTLVVQPVQAGQAGSGFDKALSGALARNGFALAASGAVVKNGHTLRYAVAPLDAGVLVRVDLDSKSAARLYSRTDKGALVAASPFTVRVSQ